MNWFGKRARKDESAENPELHRRPPPPLIPPIDHPEYITLLIQAHSSLQRHRETLNSAREKFLALRNFELEDIDALSQPRPSTLLWPSSILLDGNQEKRFFSDSKINQSLFTFFGRPFVGDILRSRKNRIYLYGPGGVGKSHLLAAIALVKSIRHARGLEGALPVCFIPDLRGALDGYVYFECLVQALINKPECLAELVQIEPSDIPSLVKWSRNQSIVFIADQCHAVVGNPQLSDDLALYTLIKDSSIQLIFTDSFNQTTVDVFSTSTGGADPAHKILIPPFTEAEYQAFITTKFPDLIPFLVPAANEATEAQNMVQEVTGFVPLQVYKLGCQLVKKTPLDVNVVLEALGAFSKEIQAQFERNLEVFFSGEKEPNILELKVYCMSTAARGDRGFRDQGSNTRSGGLTRYVDWDFFYPEGEKMAAKPVSALALCCCEAAISKVKREIDAAARKKKIQSISEAYSLGNPSVNELIAEGLVNNCLTFCDLPRLNLFKFPSWPTSLEGENRRSFQRQRGYEFLENDQASLLLPNMWNFPHVDSVLVYQRQGVCYLVGIRITLQSPKVQARSLDFLLARNHINFVPQAHQGSYRVALLWIVPDDYVAVLPTIPQGAIQGVGTVPEDAISQAAVSLESFEQQSGVPIPRL